MKKTLWTALLVSALGVFSASASIIIDFAVTGSDNDFTGYFEVESIDSLVMDWNDISDYGYNDTSLRVVEYAYGSYDEFDPNSSHVLWKHYLTEPDSYIRFNGTELYSFLYTAPEMPWDDPVLNNKTWGELIANAGGSYALSDSVNSCVWDYATVTSLWFSGGSVTFTSEAVPEPATAGLLGVSFGALWLFRRIKNRYRS